MMRILGLWTRSYSNGLPDNSQQTETYHIDNNYEYILYEQSHMHLAV